MWFHLALLLLVGAAVADHDGGWIAGNEYKYRIQSRTMTGWDTKSPKQFAGVMIEGVLNIQAKSPEMLMAWISKPKYGSTNAAIMPEGWDSKMSDSWQFQEFPISGKVFIIKIKHGLIRDIEVEKDVPTWEINFVKSLVSQMQIDGQGENVKWEKSFELPQKDNPFGTFTTMEDSVSGKCEVIYDVTPWVSLQNEPSLVPLPNINGNDKHIEIIKTKNYSNCVQRPKYSFGVMSENYPGAELLNNEQYFSESATSRIIISGNFQRYTIQSAVTTNKISVNPRIIDNEFGNVYSKVNVTLVAINPIHKPVIVSTDVKSTGNLVYYLNSETMGVETKLHPSVSLRSLEDQLDEYSSKSKFKDVQISSEEDVYLKDMPPWLTLMATKINPIQTAINIASDIANDIQNFGEISSSETLEKFTILSKIISTMDTHQISQMESRLSIKPLPFVKEAAHAIKIIGDAVIQAGTQAALEIVKKWLEKMALKNVDAAVMIAQIPKVARMPTDKYIETFFDIITSPKVTGQELVNATAPIAFAELVRQAQDKKQKNFYPINFLKHISVKDQKVVDTYIPYMADQLKKAVKDGDNVRIQTYIRAIGRFGHPEIVSVFKPYLRNKYSLSPFQRLYMVLSMDKLAETDQELARSVFYKIYANKHEAHEVRCSAVFLISKTNPPVNMLQRMAEFAKDDHYQVSASVKSLLENSATLKRPIWQKLARDANIAKKILPTTNYRYDASRLFSVSKYDPEEDNSYMAYIRTIGSDDAIVPKAVDASVYSVFHGFIMPRPKIGYAVSSIKKIMDRFTSIKKHDQKSIVEEIARSIKIIPENAEQIEGNIHADTLYGTHFYPFDEYTVDAVKKNIVKYFQTNSMKTSQPINYNKMTSYKVAISLPTESGMPFFHHIEIPSAVSVNGKIKFNVPSKDSDSPIAVDVNSEIHFMLANKIQGRFGFVALFENQHYTTGVDEKTEIYVPMKMDLKVESMKKFDVQMRPINVDTSKIKVFHHSVVPYTSKTDLYDVKPMSMSNNTKLVREPTAEQTSKKISLKMDLISVEGKSDDSESWITSYPEFTTSYKKIDVYINPNKIKSDWVQVRVAYEKQLVTKDSDQKKTEKITSESDIDAIKSQVVQKVNEDIMSSDGTHVFDATFDWFGTSSKFVIAMGQEEPNKGQRLMRFYSFLNTLPKTNPKEYVEVCASGQVKTASTTFADLDELIKNPQKDEFNVEISAGKDCANGEKIYLRGSQTRSKNRSKIIENIKSIQICQKEIREGNKWAWTCEEASKIAALRDQIDLVMGTESDWMKHILNNAIHFFTEEVIPLYSKVKVASSIDPNISNINMKIKFSDNFDNAKITMHTSEMDVSIPPIDVTPISNFIGLPLSEYSTTMFEQKEKCTIGKNYATTLDQTIYPMNFGNCWHVIMTTYPKKDSKNPYQMVPIPEDQRIAIMSRDVDNTRELKVMMGENKEVKMKIVNDVVQVWVNGQPVDVSNNKYYLEKDGNETVFEIYKIANNIVKFKSDVYKVDAIYNGYFVQVAVSKDYYNAVRGICGNFDGVSVNDFITPNNCVMKKAKEFAATYAVVQDICEGSAKKYHQDAKKSECIPITKLYSESIGDEEADWEFMRGNHNPKSNMTCMIHRTKIAETSNDVCFTITPLSTCAFGCKPQGTKVKSYPIYCMPKNEESLEMKKRVEMGANPDLSSRSAFATHKFEIPITCVAA